MKIKPSPRLAGSVRRVLVSVGLGASLVLGSAGAASAGTWSFNDPIKDVVLHDEGAEDYEGSQPAPERAAGDVQRIAVSHTQTRLIVRLNLRRSLPRSNWGIFEHIQTPRARFHLGVHRHEGSGFVGLIKLGDDDIAGVRCTGIAITYAPRSVQISLPTRCLGTPRVVRIGASVDTSEPAAERYYEDDALGRGESHMSLRMSPPIARG